MKWKGKQGLSLGLGFGPGGHRVGCQCCANPQAASESLEELEFLRSACTAAQTGQVEKLRKIIATRPEAVHSDGTADGGSGYTPLHYAARGGHVEAVKLLIDAGADVNRQTTAGGATPLHRAAYMGHRETVQLLLKHGANAALQDSDGETPLHKAAARGHKEVFQLLADSSPAALQLRDRHGLTAMQKSPMAAGCDGGVT